MPSRQFAQDAGSGFACVPLGTSALVRSAIRVLSLAMAIASSSAAIAASNVVQYGYDAANNVRSITRQAVAGLSVLSFSPSSGFVGATVVVSGSGFSPTPANNAVTFNGTSAVVNASTGTTLNVVVPTGATSGPVSVTVGGNTATSSAIFTVLPPSAPTIASFAPASGDSGAVVSVTGTSFVPGATSVKLNGVTTSATIASATSLSFVVPGATASGRITATTAVGTGTSASDFIIPPPGIVAADIKVAMHVDVGGAMQVLSLAPANKHALLMFDGVQDGYYTFQFDSLQASPTSINSIYRIYRPDNTLLVSGFVGNLYPRTIHVPKLPMSGTYSVLLSPGVANLNTGVRVAMDPLVTIDSSAVAMSTATTGQSLRSRFQAVIGQRLGLGMIGFTMTPTGSPATNFRVYNPDGTQYSGGVASCSSPSVSNPLGNCDGEFTPTQTGEHTVVAELALSAMGTFSLQGSSQVTGTLVPDVAQDVTMSRVGQDARFALAVSSGDSLAVEMTGVTSTPANQPFVAYVYRPDGSLMTTATSSTTFGNAYVNLGTLATGGTYAIELDPNNGTYGSVRLAAKAGPLLTTTDPPVAFAATALNETPRFRFAATAGQNLALEIDTLTHTPASGAASYLNVFKPDGTQITGQSCSTFNPGGRCKLSLSNLPVTGVYSAAIVSAPNVKVAGNISGAADLSGSLTANTAVPLDVTRFGQNVRYSFTGAAGDSYAIELANLSTTPSGNTALVTVFKPDGLQLAGGASNSSQWGTVFALPPLPTSGTYTVLVDVAYGSTWQGRLTLKSGSALTVDGATPALATSYPGEVVRFTFPGTANQRVDLGAAGLTYASPSSNTTTAYLFRPDGVQVSSFGWNPASLGGGGDLTYVNLLLTGTYSVLVVPGGNSTISGGTLAVSTPTSGSFTIGGGAQTVALTRPGQTARYTFSGTAAQLLRLNWTNTSVSPAGTVIVTVYRPDGFQLTSGSLVHAATGGLDLPSLPSTGTYTVSIDPPAASSLAVDLTVVTQ